MRRLPGRISRTLLVLALALGLPGRAGAEPHLVIVTSHGAQPYQDSVKGFLGELEAQGIAYRQTLLPLAEGAATERRLGAVPRTGSTLFFGVGSLACRSLARQHPEGPTVAALILTGAELAQARNATGVRMEFPLELQLRFLARVLPDAGSVGVLYSRENASRVRQAEALAAQLHLNLQPRFIDSPVAIPHALAGLRNRVGALWGLADSVVMTPETARQLLVFCFRNRIPLVGPSAAWAKAGALYALDWDYVDLGRQCGSLAARILRGRAAKSIPLEGPRKMVYVINSRTAEQMRLRLPAAIVQGARERY